MSVSASGNCLEVLCEMLEDVEHENVRILQSIKSADLSIKDMRKGYKLKMPPVLTQKNLC